MGRELAAGQHRLVRLVAELDVSGEWAFDGARTCAHWVADALDVEVCTAREWLRIGHALARLDVIDRAFGEGRLSYTKVRALTRFATVDNQVELCELAERVPAGRLAVALAAWLARRETPEETERRQHGARGLSWHVEPDGMIAGSFRLPPADAAVLIGAVDAMVALTGPGTTPGSGSASAAEGGVDASAGASVPLAVAATTTGGEPRRFAGPSLRAADAFVWPSVAQQRADALVALVCGGGARVVTEVVLHVRGDGCTLDDGTPVAGSVVERLAPEAFIRALIHDADRRPINASGRRRHPSARQRRVVRERDRACIDCGTTEFLEYDHVPDYERSGRTVVDELELRCRTCHRARHDTTKNAA